MQQSKSQWLVSVITINVPDTGITVYLVEWGLQGGGDVWLQHGWCCKPGWVTLETYHT